MPIRKMFRAALTLAIAFTLVLPLQPQTRGNRRSALITITAGTPVRLSTANDTKLDRILIQAQVAASGGVVYLMLGVDTGSTAPAVASWPAVQLYAATSTAPGGSYSDAGQNIDLSRIWIDGAHSGDTVLVTYEIK